MRHALSIVLTLCLFAFLTPAARAEAAINAEGAAVLKKQVEDSLYWRTGLAKFLGQGLTAEGAVEVTPKDGFYEVRLPRLTQTRPKGKLDLGIIIVNAVPGEPGQWLTRLTLPKEMTFYDEANTPQAVITIGEQQFAAIWWPDKEMAEKVDSLYKNIVVKGVGAEPWLLTLDTMKTTVDLKENNGVWAGPAHFEASGIKTDFPGRSGPDINSGAGTAPGKEAAQIVIGKITSRSAYNALDMRQTLDIRKALQDILKSGAAPDEKETLALLTRIRAKAAFLGWSMDGSFELKDFSFRKAGTPPMEFAFDSFTFSGATLAGETGQDKSRFLLQTGLQGLRIAPVSPVLAGLVPSAFNSEISIDNIPMKKIGEALYEALQKPTGEAAMPALPDIMKESGVTLTVQNTFARSADIDSTLAGKITANPAAPLGATGQMTLSIKGLDETLRKLQAVAFKPDADPQMLGYAAILMGLQMKGAASVAADGKTLRNYVLELTPDGQILLNGVGAQLPLPIPGLPVEKSETLPQAPALSPVPVP